jgi:F1F0 ATPase subunit 2
MIDLLSLVFALIAGMMLGAIFFGGLWWTVRKGVSAKHPAFWFFGSMLLRTCIVVLGFYFILGDSWQRLVAGLLGFIVARLIVTRLTLETEQTSEMEQEAGHAP